MVTKSKPLNEVKEDEEERKEEKKGKLFCLFHKNLIIT
jgi:hypothetical protein